LTRIEALGKALYGISQGKVFRLDTHSLKKDVLIWKPVTGIPSGVIHTSSTRNGSHIWLQTKKSGYLFNTREELVGGEKEVNYLRNYGDSSDYYIDSYPHEQTIVIYASLEQFTKDVPYAIFNTDMENIIGCREEDWEKYRDIRLIGEDSYFISRC
jgi:hypothetical protein